jgi:RNA polymerase sigma-70 factor (ECF subfamily)
MEHQERHRRWERLGRLLDPIHDRAQSTARNLCRSPADGDDLYQEAVLRAFEKLHTLRDEDRFRSWFFAVLISVHRSRSRRAFWKRFLPLDQAPSDDAGWIGGDGRIEEETFKSARRAARALARLPVAQREAVVLHEIEGFTMEEIAALTGASVPAVKSRVLRGRERLRRFYTAHLGTDAPAPDLPARRRASSPERPERSTMGLLSPLPVTVVDGTSPEGGRHD